MRTIHYVVIAAALGLIAIFYFGVNNVPPKVAHTSHDGHDHSEAAPGPMMAAAAPASLDSLLGAARTQLPAHASQEVTALEQKISAIRDSARMAPLFTELAQLWQQHHQPPIAAYYIAQNARLEQSEKKLTFAGQIFLDLMEQTSSASVQMWEGLQAKASFEQALALNPANDTARLGLASSLVNTGQPMQGVAILRELTAKDSSHVAANLMLGHMSLQSGQYDKAKSRFETVLRREPENVDAIMMLAQLHNMNGEKEQQIELLQRAKKIINNPDFSKDVDAHIQSLNNK